MTNRAQFAAVLLWPMALSLLACDSEPTPPQDPSFEAREVPHEPSPAATPPPAEAPRPPASDAAVPTPPAPVPEPEPPPAEVEPEAPATPTADASPADEPAVDERQPAASPPAPSAPDSVTDPVADANPPPPPPDFEFETLEKRLRETSALGFLTKLELKNQIDDLMKEVRQYHRQQDVDLAAIREEFDLLVMKVMTLLQEEEAELASEISRARGELWAILSDPERFAELEAT